MNLALKEVSDPANVWEDEAKIGSCCLFWEHQQRLCEEKQKLSKEWQFVVFSRPLYVTVVYQGKCSHCMRVGVAVPLSGTMSRLRQAVAQETKIPAEQVPPHSAFSNKRVDKDVLQKSHDGLDVIRCCCCAAPLLPPLVSIHTLCVTNSWAQAAHTVFLFADRPHWNVLRRLSPLLLRWRRRPWDHSGERLHLRVRDARAIQTRADPLKTRR